jgi:carboxypeptidase PM20D1
MKITPLYTGRPRLFAWAALAALFLPAVAAHASSPAERLSGALRFETISYESQADFRSEPFVQMHAYLAEQFPAAHRALERETVADWSLLYTWRGSDPSARPFLLTSHLDVVPVPEGTEVSWEQPPYGGVIADGHVWGRGALDNKSGVLATLEAVEALASEGFAPTRTIYLAFGHDEERGGDEGAGAIAALLAERGVQLDFSLDEGMAIVSEPVPGVDTPIAVVGIAEKGYMNLTLTSRALGGHSSMPPRRSAIGRLGEALARLEESPVPARMNALTLGFLETIAPELPFSQRMAIRHRWLLGGLLERGLADNAVTNAMIRTTTAVTIIEGGTKANILPRSAAANVNFRLIPGDTPDQIVAHVRDAIDDPEIEIEVTRAQEASAVASTEGASFGLLRDAIGGVDPEALVAPGLVLGGTDSKHYGQVADDAYRFLPVRFSQEDRTRFHGINERIAVSELERAIRFYRLLIEKAAGPR